MQMKRNNQFWREGSVEDNRKEVSRSGIDRIDPAKINVGGGLLVTSLLLSTDARREAIRGL